MLDDSQCSICGLLSLWVLVSKGWRRDGKLFVELGEGMLQRIYVFGKLAKRLVHGSSVHSLLAVEE
jgi:hypothetical protein